MSDMLHKGQSWLAAKLTRFASRMVVYQRDELSVDLPPRSASPNTSKTTAKASSPAPKSATS